MGAKTVERPSKGAQRAPVRRGKHARGRTSRVRGVVICPQSGQHGTREGTSITSLLQKLRTSPDPQSPSPMRRTVTLPDPPDFHIEVVADRSPPATGFLKYVSRDVVTVDVQGRRSPAFAYDEVDRQAIDAVVIVPHFVEDVASLPVRFVVVRSVIRPPFALRDERRSPIPEPANRGLWEVPAGLVEASEQSLEGLRRAAARELLEEAGFRVEPEALKDLGPSALPCPGVCAERHFFYHVEVAPQSHKKPTLDGSHLEEAGVVIAVPLSALLCAARAGRLQDSKTELALRRLDEMLALCGDVQ